jgi:hypothetical protein
LAAAGSIADDGYGTALQNRGSSGFALSSEEREVMARVFGHGAATKTPAQQFALWFGVLYLIVGLVGFSLTRADTGTSATLVIFAVNALHNLLHLAVGLVWIVASQVRTWAKTTNLLIGIAYALLTVLGFAGVLRFLAIGNLLDPDNFLHLATAAASIYFGSAGAEHFGLMPPRMVRMLRRAS